jgi:hypothetical protein
MDKEISRQEKRWIDAKLARYGQISAERRAQLVKDYRKAWPYSMGPNLSDLEKEIMGID